MSTKTTKTTNYDEVASSYDGRYQRNEYPGSERTLASFIGTAPQRVLEVGCGTGHWLAELRARGHEVSGIDPSLPMLQKACAKLPPSRLARARAEQLPFASAAFDRVIMVNAIHHFRDPKQAIVEARRVLAPGGAMLTIALDPSAGMDDWAIYDFFAGTRERDCERFPATSAIRAWMQEAGFERCETSVAELIDKSQAADDKLESGALHKHSTSQLTELSDEAYRAGLDAIAAAARSASARGEALLLRSHLRLFGTAGYVAG